MNKKIDKLLKALKQKGVIYCIDRHQFYSKKNKRVCTKITLHREYDEDIPDEEKEIKQYFWSNVELIKYLAERFEEVT